MSIDITADAFGASIGKGLALLGEGLGDIAKLEAYEKRERENFNLQEDALKLDNWTTTLLNEEGRKAQGTDGYGYTPSIMEKYKVEVDKRLATIQNPRLRDQWRVQYAKLGNNLYEKAYKQEWAIRDATTNTKLDLSRDEILKRIRDNPQDLEREIGKFNAMIDKIPLYGAEQKTALKQQWRQMALIAYGNARTQQPGGAEGVVEALTPPGKQSDREKFAMTYLEQQLGLPRHIIAGIVGNLVHESGGLQTSIRGDQGQSAGIAQWHKQRLRDLQGFAEVNGRDWRDMKTQLDFLVHELKTGAGGNTATLKALQNAKSADEAAGIFAELFERPQGSGTGDYRNVHGWGSRASHARRLAGVVANPDDLKLNELPYQQREQLRAGAQGAFTRQQQQEAALAKQTNKAWVDSAAIDADRGFFNKTNLDQALGAGLIQDHESYRKITAAIERYEKGVANFDRGMSILNGQRDGDPYNSDDKDGLNEVYKKFRPEEKLQRGADITNEKRIAPKDFASDLRAAIVGSNESKKLQALSIAAQLIDNNPRAFAGVENSDAITGPAIKFMKARNNGRTPQQALGVVNEMFTPEYSQGQKVRNDEAKKFREALKTDDPGFKKLLDSTYWFGDIRRDFIGSRDSIEYRPSIRGPIVTSLYADYADLAEEGYRIMGNSDDAVAYAQSKIKGLYGTIGNSIMKFAPSRAYPTLNGSHDWILKQAANDVRQYWVNKKDPQNPDGVVVNVTEGDIALVPVGIETAERWSNPNATEPPRYYVWYRRKTGNEPGDYVDDFLYGPDGRPVKWFGALPTTGTLTENIMIKEAQKDQPRKKLMEQGTAVGVPLSPEEVEEAGKALYPPSKPSVQPDPQPMDWYQGRVRSEVPPGVPPRRQVPVVPGGRRDGGPR